MTEDPSIPFRILPRLFWVNAPLDVRRACGFGVYERIDMLVFGWLLFEIDLGVFRRERALTPQAPR